MSQQSPKIRPTDVDVVPQDDYMLLVRPLTPYGILFMKEHFSPDHWKWFNGALAVDPRYMKDVVDNMRGSGLTVRIGPTL